MKELDRLNNLITTAKWAALAAIVAAAIANPEDVRFTSNRWAEQFIGIPMGIDVTDEDERYAYENAQSPNDDRYEYEHDEDTVENSPICSETAKRELLTRQRIQQNTR